MKQKEAVAHSEATKKSKSKNSGFKDTLKR